MEFSGGLQTKEDITVSHISNSDLVASSTDKLSIGTDLCTFINCMTVMSSFVYNPAGNSMAFLFPNHTVQRHIEPNCSNKCPAAKCVEIGYSTHYDILYVSRILRMLLLWLDQPLSMSQ